MDRFEACDRSQVTSPSVSFRQQLGSQSLDAVFDGLLEFWDVGDEMDFSVFSRALDMFLPVMLKSLALTHPCPEKIALVLAATDDHSFLVKAALLGTIPEQEVDGWDFEEARVYTASILERVRWFEPPENLLINSDVAPDACPSSCRRVRKPKSG